MSLRNLVIAVVFIFFSSKVQSQNMYRNSVSLELGGHTYAYSLNYERYFNIGLVGRIGISYFDGSFYVPLTLGKIFGKKKHHIEITGGVMYLNYYRIINTVGSRYNSLFLTSFIGYRYQNPEKRFFFRIGLTPIYKFYVDDPRDEPGLLDLTGGVGAGYRFNFN